jgi:hypothetical protein
MRAKVILSVAVLALAVLAPAIYFHSKAGEPAPAAEPVASDDSTNAAPSALPKILHRVSGAAQAQSAEAVQQDAAADLNAADHAEYVTKRNAELYQMGVSQNPAALHTILTELHNPDPAIRSTALTATMDFGSKDAVPTLKREMTWAEDPHDKLEIQKAIDFLQTQPFSLDENGMIAPDQPDKYPPAR